MEVSTFEEDLLNLRPFAERLERFITIEHNFVEGSLVIALNSRFGAGKTTFLRMWAHELAQEAPAPPRPLVVQLNAWESDYYGDPLFALISGLVRQMPRDNSQVASIVEAAKDLGWLATAFGNQFVQHATGLDPLAAGDLAKNKKAQRQLLRDDAFSMYQDRHSAMQNLRNAVRDLTKSSGRHILFLVDELDRCRPNYAIEYLETIKHIFDVPGTVFILAADRRQLENSARAAFGPDLDFDEYYRKFIHREVSLPEITEPSYRAIASKYVAVYLQRQDLRTCFMELDEHRIKNIVELTAALRLTPRQMQEVFRVLGHLFETSEGMAGKLRWPLAVGSIAMAAFRVGRPEIYQLLGTRQLEPEKAHGLLGDLLPAGDSDWWFTLFLTGDGLVVEAGVSPESILERLNVERHGGLANWRSYWGVGSSNRFSQIYQKIEHILQWST